MISKNLIDKIGDLLTDIPIRWEGKEAILEMKNTGYPHWRQMEWIGFYFQFLCETRLASVMEIPAPKYGRVKFDGFSEIPWDFKTHPEKNAKGEKSNSVITNDELTIVQAIEKFGGVGLILAVGEAEYNDQDRNFQNWHQKLKGDLSDYEKDRILRKAPSRIRKTKFSLRDINLILLDDKIIRQLPSFQKGFRNSDGSPRNSKVLLNLEKIKPIKVIRFT